MRPFTYTKAENVAQAVDALAAGGPRARLLAGGTTLYDLMKLEIETPPAVVDVHRLAELAGFDTSGDRELVFGAGARMADVAEDGRLRRDYPALSESLWRAASQQLRNMATLGGNLLQRTRCPYFRGGEPFPCNKRDPGSGCAALDGLDRANALFGGSEHCVAVYPGDWATALVAFDAEIDVLGPGGARSLPLAELHREPGDTPQHEHHLAPGEIITRIRVPVTPAGRGSAYLKIRDRESYAFALVSAAVALTLDGDGRVGECRVAVGGVATRPWRVPAAEQALRGQPVTGASARAAGAA
ncbi:FAD binding domain-containing protein, partial [Catellatospora methionotrophica]|uniref:FAD binding domain-containing protein n=1 Tax=Catellatospora methionotrophica TaxID=121620 RepID=UPI0033CF2DA9